MTRPGGSAKAAPRWLAALPIGLAVFGRHSELIFANPRFLTVLGLDAPQPKLSGLADLLETLRRVDAEGAALLASQFPPGQDTSDPVRWRRGDTVIDSSVTRLPDGGQLCAVTARQETDPAPDAVIEARRAQQAAEAACQAKSHFLATVGHELRTPLNAVIGFSEAMLREADNPSPARVAEFARQIGESGRTLLGLINVILDVASIESGRFALASAPIDVARLIRSAMRQVDAVAQAAELALATELPASLPPVHGDERRLLQVLHHLLSNAVKFTEAGGTITVGARQEGGDTLLIFVRDSGIGIAPEELERAFQPFTHGGAASSGPSQGARLGLYVSRALVT
ncbi:MAG TPA: PAS domain-containing sensor histidine kinase, partial [Acetobacteraceae bacterium]|nr:PAS domain-containing sensor histidine kinase [Acetobacteraceae bacterium]